MPSLLSSGTNNNRSRRLKAGVVYVLMWLATVWFFGQVFAGPAAALAASANISSEATPLTLLILVFICIATLVAFRAAGAAMIAGVAIALLPAMLALFLLHPS